LTDIQTMRLAIKEAKSIMAEYPHMENDEDFVPEIAWILFLNVFEYFEKKRHALDSNYKKIIPEECSWDYWVIDEKDIFTDDDLTTHLNSKVLPKLKNLDGSKENKNIDVVRSVFKDFSLRIDDGITLRRILDKLKIIKINEVNDLVNLSKVYDEELEKMKYAAGKKASFITVRPIVNFIVEQLKPNLEKSETVMDLACGTSGFLVKSLEYMKENTVPFPKKFKEKLKENTLFGYEKKPRNYLLGMLNMLLHDIDSPNIIRKNTLETRIREIGDTKFDVIMTNPTFDEKESDEIARNLKSGYEIDAPALHFLYYAMTSLKEKGRCAMLIDSGSLSGTGKKEKFRKDLLDNFNLHTVVQLPKSIFAPYAGAKTRILFFNEGGPTKEIWYYDLPVREGLKNFNKTNPAEDSDFEELSKWFENKEKNDNAWIKKVEELEDLNLEVPNPNNVEEENTMTPHELIAQIISDEKKTLDLLTDVENLINNEIPK